eukprot:2527484-Alexandrium_andersonii.AAC.1
MAPPSVASCSKMRFARLGPSARLDSALAPMLLATRRSCLQTLSLRPLLDFTSARRACHPL